ncbi:hypothetical protein CTI12_AA614910 [Artemisia annua]|uniref:Uncharacterized protein n=1 Tax=Artemisia annua TaxID=35608 RepID=A0A2U1KDM9_ARTAN|nr:hypothetical protein CTI12_AA614910 [Artemisia annua]
MTAVSSIAQRKTSKCNQNTNAASSSISKTTNVRNNTQTPVATKRVYKPRGKTRARNVSPSEVHTIDFQNDGSLNHLPEIQKSGERCETKVNAIIPEIIATVKDVLDNLNPLVKNFRVARDRYKENQQADFKLKLIGKRDKDGRQYNMPTMSEVAGLIVGDEESCKHDRDIVLQTQAGLVLTDEQKKNFCLFQIELLLRSNNSSLRKFEGMPYPDDASILSSNNRLIHDELAYNTEELKQEHVRLEASLNDQQKKMCEDWSLRKIENEFVLNSFVEQIEIGHALDIYLVHSRYPTLIDTNTQRWLHRNWGKSGFISGHSEAKRRKSNKARG